MGECNAQPFNPRDLNKGAIPGVSNLRHGANIGTEEGDHWYTGRSVREDFIYCFNHFNPIWLVPQGSILEYVVLYYCGESFLLKIAAWQAYTASRCDVL